MEEKPCDCGKEKGESCGGCETAAPQHWCPTCERGVDEKRCPYCGLKARSVRSGNGK